MVYSCLKVPSYLQAERLPLHDPFLGLPLSGLAVPEGKGTEVAVTVSEAELEAEITVVLTIAVSDDEAGRVSIAEDVGVAIEDSLVRTEVNRVVEGVVLEVTIALDDAIALEALEEAAVEVDTTVSSAVDDIDEAVLVALALALAPLEMHAKEIFSVVSLEPP